MGFPAGAPEGVPSTVTTHSMIRGTGFFVSLAAVVSA
jgi:hypothetical protein